MNSKELTAILFLTIAEYMILSFSWHKLIAVLCAIGIVPVYFILQKKIENCSKKEYTSDKYTHDIKILGIVALSSIAVFILLFIQKSLSFAGGFSIGITLLIYFMLYIDFLRKKFSLYADYSKAYQLLQKGSIGLMLYILYNILYYT